jgi:hypothetical protein
VAGGSEVFKRERVVGGGVVEPAGCVGLVSSGSSAQESAFFDASESGGDVFFLTSAKLSTLDFDNALDVYDAHECTVASPCLPVPATEPRACDTEASCKAAPSPQPLIFGPPSSATSNGPGNQTPPGPPKPTAEQVRLKHLAAGLRVCRKKHNKHKRTACERRVRKRYAKPAAKAKGSSGSGRASAGRAGR